MRWSEPKIWKVELSGERPHKLDEFNLDMAYEREFRKFFEWLVDDGHVMRLSVLEPSDVEVVQKPQPPGEIRTCEVDCAGRAI